MTYTTEDFERDANNLYECYDEELEGMAKRYRDRIITAYRDLVAENERLTDALKTIADNGGVFNGYNAMNLRAIRAEARAEAAERVCEEAAILVRSVDGWASGDFHYKLRDALAAWEATTPLHANTADVTVRASHVSSQLTSEVTSAACEEGAE